MELPKYDGFSVLISIKDGVAGVKFGTFEGQEIPIEDLDARMKNYLTRYHDKVVELLVTIRQPYIQLFLCELNGDLVLTDAQVNASKMLGPGMIAEIFSKVITTPSVIKIEQISEEILDLMEKGSGNYSGDLLIKPSLFKTITRGKYSRPLYAAVRRHGKTG